MNALITKIAILPTAVGVLLLAITVGLSAALVAQWVVRRSPAARHAVLLWALVAVGASPLLFVTSKVWRIAPVVPLPQMPVFEDLYDPIAEVTTIDLPTVIAADLAPAPVDLSPPAAPPAEGNRSTSISAASVLYGVWLLGASCGLARIAHGLLITRRLRRGAVPLAGETVLEMRDRLAEVLGKPAPEICMSQDAAVPVAIGLFRPVVLMPCPILGQLDSIGLLQVLLHESAHAVRHDPLIGLYQRVVASLLWFHPLVHVSNRLLDGAREELCDNYALRVAPATDYARTLLGVARSLVDAPGPLVGAMMFSSTRRLERRVATLLLPGRNTMTHLTAWKSAAIATAFLGGSYVLTSLAAPPAAPAATIDPFAATAPAATTAPDPLTTPPPAAAKSAGYDFSQKVDFQVGATQLGDGDSITIEEVYGTSSEITVGNMYVVKGTYRLGSGETASLAVHNTTSGPSGYGTIPTQRTQTMMIHRGEGRFSLLFYMWDKGNPHVAFYPAHGGSSVANVYFGTGESLLVRGWWEESGDPQAVPARTGRRTVAAAQQGEQQSLDKLHAQLEAQRKELEKLDSQVRRLEELGKTTVSAAPEGQPPAK